MRGLTAREKVLLGLCFLTVFIVVNAFAIRWAVKSLGGGTDNIPDLKNQLADYELWLEDANTWAIRDDWLAKNMPILADGATGKAQGDLLQELQDEMFQRKLKIDRQSLQEPKVTENFQEVSVKFDFRGDAETVIDWLSTLQAPEKFVVIKYLELELDSRSRETEPQAVCELIVARWFRPPGSTLPPGAPVIEAPDPETTSGPETTGTAPTAGETGETGSDSTAMPPATVDPEPATDGTESEKNSQPKAGDDPPRKVASNDPTDPQPETKP
ncbi:MAG: hypothetical protein HKN23_12405 [Verrucomicrobiales bacterium]|nr:hypothetical protein [Verrucomicrobiales bacterium]